MKGTFGVVSLLCNNKTPYYNKIHTFAPLFAENFESTLFVENAPFEAKFRNFLFLAENTVFRFETGSSS